jgi:hypothetical protein
VLRLEHTVAGSPAAVAVQDVAYDYDSLGNLTSGSDATAAATTFIQNFSYDNLNRLKCSRETAPIAASPATSTWTRWG